MISWIQFSISWIQFIGFDQGIVREGRHIPEFMAQVAISPNVADGLVGTRHRLHDKPAFVMKAFDFTPYWLIYLYTAYLCRRKATSLKSHAENPNQSQNTDRRRGSTSPVSLHYKTTICLAPQKAATCSSFKVFRLVSVCSAAHACAVWYSMKRIT